MPYANFERWDQSHLKQRFIRSIPSTSSSISWSDRLHQAVPDRSDYSDSELRSGQVISSWREGEMMHKMMTKVRAKQNWIYPGIRIPASVKTALLPREPWPCDPAAETAVQPMACCSVSSSSQGLSSPDDCFFIDTGNAYNMYVILYHYTCIYVYMHIYIYIYMYTYICIYVITIYAHIYIYIYIYICMYVCV